MGQQCSALKAELFYYVESKAKCLMNETGIHFALRDGYSADVYI